MGFGPSLAKVQKSPKAPNSIPFAKGNQYQNATQGVLRESSRFPIKHPCNAAPFEFFNTTQLHFKNLLNSISGLVAEYIVAIDVTRVRFPADADCHWLPHE